MDAENADLGASMFVEGFLALSERVLANAKAHGFEDQPNAVSIALMHSELSEALEAERHGNPPDDKVPDDEECRAILWRHLHPEDAYDHKTE